MAIEKNYKQIALARLVLNPENDRFEPVINEEEAIEMMLLKLGTKIFNLASDIIRRGIIRKSKFPWFPERSVQFSGKRTKRSVQKKAAHNTYKAGAKG